MEFENTFSVRAPIDEVYAALLDLERVAPAMPGAEMLEKTGDDAYKVAIKVKLGPVSMTYRGDVSIVERDPQAHTARMSVRAKEARGQGTANAEVSIALDEQGEETQARIHANVQLAGKAASLGRGIIDDVSARLVDQFAANLASMLEGAPAETASGAPAGSAAAAGGGGGSRAAGSAAEASGAAGRAASIGNGSAVREGGPRPADQPRRPPPAQPEEADLDALALGASVAADRMKDPRVLLGTLLAVLLLGFLVGRRSRA